jgi:hypothetical protein
MILQALHTSGRLDVSSQESLQGEEEVFRLTLKPGQVVEVKDHWRYLKNIDSAINSGLLKVISYNYSHKGEEVTHAELDETVAYLLSIITGSGSAEINVYPVEPTDGVNKTWTLPAGQKFVTAKIAVILNGQTLPPADFIESADHRSVTLHPDVPAPRTGEVITLTYIKDTTPP